MERKKGTAGNDVLTGTNLSDALFGLAGNDRLYGLLGNDYLYGDGGNDTLVGGGGIDTLFGGLGNDLYVVDNAADLIWEPAASTAPVLASKTASGAAGNNDSVNPVLSGDGRYVAFESLASNFFAGDPPYSPDVFVKDLVTGTIKCVSTNAAGIQGKGASQYPSITPDGRYVMFESAAANLVAGDTNGAQDVFLKNVATGAITRVSTSTSGKQANGDSWGGQISADGKHLLFESDATNLIDGTTTNDYGQAFLKNLLTGRTSLVSSNSAGVQGNGESWPCCITDDSRYVFFESDASNLVAGDTNGGWDAFIKDLVTGRTTRVSTSTGGVQGNDWSGASTMTPDGRYLVIVSRASNLVAGDINDAVDIFVKDTATNVMTRVSTNASGVQGNGHSWDGDGISADGRFVVFDSEASNLVPGDTNGCMDVFVKDLLTGAIARVSVDASGMQAKGASEEGNISRDGRYITFNCEAGNLVPGGTDGTTHVYRVTNPLLAGGGVDTVQASVSFTLPANIENLTLLGAAPLKGTGNAAHNALTGNGGNNVLSGLGGNDTLSGGGGNDTLVGGPGIDRYVVNGGDTVTEGLNAGTDTVQSSVTYTLGANVENLILTGGVISGTGNGLANSITGSALANVLTGLGGNDTLNGGAGADRMIGGPGDDTYVVNVVGDVVTELAGLGTGKDLVQSSITYTLGANVENLVLTGVALINGTGNALDNVLSGNSVKNVLNGLGGNDTLNGGGGIDQLAGGAGDDTYVINDSDSVTEAAGGGTDTVQASIGYTLGSNVENLVLTGAAAIDGAGNSLANGLTGNGTANVLDGLGGNDALTGGAGADTFAFTTAGGPGNVDTIADFEVGVDKIALENAIFAALATPGALSADNFSNTGAPADVNDYVVYDPGTGALYYYADGNVGGAPAVELANLTGSPDALSAADFVIT